MNCVSHQQRAVSDTRDGENVDVIARRRRYLYDEYERQKSDVRRLRQLGTEVCVNCRIHSSISAGKGNDIKTKKRKTLSYTDCRKILMHQGFVHRG